MTACVARKVALESLEGRRLLAATPYVSAGSGAMEGGDLTFTVGVRLTYDDPVGTSDREYMVGVTTGGTAKAGEDYAAPPPVEVIVPAYSRAGSATLTIRTLRDNRVEGSETVIVKTSSISGIGAGPVGDPPPSATGTIGDDPPRVSIEGDTRVNEADGKVTLTARRSGGDMTKGLSANLAVSGPAERGSDYRVPSAVQFGPDECVVQVEMTILDDTATEAPEGNLSWAEDAIISIAPGGSTYIATGQPATIRIGDDTGWWYSDWEPTKQPLKFAATEVRQPLDQPIDNSDEKYRSRWYQCYEWRYMGLMDSSDDWGRAADITGQSVTFTTEWTVGKGGALDVNLEEFGVPVTIGGTYYRERTTGTGVTRAVTDGKTPAERNAQYQVAGYGLYCYVEKRVWVVKADGTEQWVGFTRQDLGFTGEVSGASQNRQRRFWLDEEADAPVRVRRTGPAAPPGPPSVISGTL